MATGVTDCCYQKAEKIRADALKKSQTARQAAALAIAIANAIQVVKNYRKQKSISDRGMKISQELHDHLRNIYFPAELQFLKEFGENGGEDIEDVEVMGRRYGGRLRTIVAKAYADKIREFKCNMPRYCTSAVQKELQNLYLERANALANASIMGQNIAFAEYRARWDTALNRRLQAIGLGKGLMDTAASLLKSAGSGLAASQANFMNNLKDAIGDFRNADIDKYRYDHLDIMRRAGGTWEDGVDIQNGIYANSQSHQPWVNADNTVRRATSMATIYGIDANGSLINNGTDGGRVQSDLSNTRVPMYHSAAADSINTAGDLGNADTVRYGSKTYAVQGSPWTGYYVTINQEDFPIKAVDDRTADIGEGGDLGNSF